MNLIKQGVKSIFHLFGCEIRRNVDFRDNFPVELSQDERNLFEHVLKKNLTLASEERLYTTMLACKHVLDPNIEGDFVECGVWRGGNSILAAGIFDTRGSNKSVYLYDTFAGMTKPSGHDVSSSGDVAEERFDREKQNGYNEWCYASIDEVKENFSQINLLERARFIQGDVLETLFDASNLPDKISVLRLDTDWYESTKVELEVLYPRLETGGVIIIDDYGHWGGAKKAVDEYFSEATRRPYLQYIDYTGRIGVKTQ